MSFLRRLLFCITIYKTVQNRFKGKSNNIDRCFNHIYIVYLYTVTKIVLNQDQCNYVFKKKTSYFLLLDKYYHVTLVLFSHKYVSTFRSSLQTLYKKGMLYVNVICRRNSLLVFYEDVILLYLAFVWVALCMPILNIKRKKNCFVTVPSYVDSFVNLHTKVITVRFNYY